jgi:Na+/citrate or Na+/malate symporter
MTEILIAITIGIVLGCTNILSYKAKEIGNKISKIALFVMLWCLAAKVGCDKEVLAQLGRLGFQSVLMAFAVIVGSFGAVWVVGRFFRNSIENIKEMESHK